MKRYLLGLLCILTLGAARTYASGMLIPKDESIPPLAIESQRVDIQIKDGTATARIEQVFRNSVNRNLEAVYVFPLPENASISDFAMYINGKRMSGELVEKDKARRTYEDIVRRMKDPALLEHMGGNLFRISVFPVPANGLQKIELEYSQTLTFEGGLYKYLYPLKTGEQASRTLADFTVSVRLNSKIPIKNIYSPTHKVGISRKGDKEAVIGFEEDKALLDRDFVLYYTVSQKEFGLNLLTHAAKDEKGFFMMMLAPSVATPETVMKKDVTFVFDSSGSMAGSKIEQTRKALEYCVKSLHDGDGFNIIGFSTDVEPFKESLVTADKKSREEALDFIRKVEARGGTAIDEALTKALAMKYESKRPGIILFLTDGRPTVGETEIETILGNAGKSNKAGVRIFVFGVGEDVNAHLLDKLAGQNGGLPQYVAPDEDIEVKVSSLADKMSNPVLAKVRVEVDKLKTSMVHPGTLPDLFSGDQITIFGRYDGSGDSVIRLVGEVNGEKREFVYEGTFPAANTDNTFIPRLWATRRVGFLLDEIRLRGESSELKDEVVRLSREYGIMTPYTSYLVLEDDNAYAQHGIDRAKSGGDGKDEKKKEGSPDALAAARRTGTSRPAKFGGFYSGRGNGSRAEKASADEMERVVAFNGPAAQPADSSEMVPMFGLDGKDVAAAAPAPASAPGDKPGEAARRFNAYGGSGEESRSALREQSGAKAVAMSKAIQEYKGQDNAADNLATVKHVGKKVFTLLDGRWIDNAFKKNMKTTTVQFGSDDYFKLIKDKPELKGFLALGTKVTVVLEDGTALVVE
jgi:Ca-activated chloride channel family protein